MSAAWRALRFGLAFACIAAGACVAFSCGGAFKGNDATNDASANDASSTNATDGAIGSKPGFDGGIGSNAQDSGSHDAGTFAFPPNSFCGMLGDAAIFCSDFDEDAAAGPEWKSSQIADDLSLVATFDGGSAPNALAATGGSRLTSPDVPITNYRGKTVVVDIPISLGSPPSTPTTQFITIAFNGANGIEGGCLIDPSGTLYCPGSTTPGSPGVHDIRFSIPVLDDGGVPGYTCAIDGVSSSNQAVSTPNPTFTLVIGGAGVNTWVGTYDNIRIYTQ